MPQVGRRGGSTDSRASQALVAAMVASPVVGGSTSASSIGAAQVPRHQNPWAAPNRTVARTAAGPNAGSAGWRCLRLRHRCRAGVAHQSRRPAATASGNGATTAARASSPIPPSVQTAA
jgi:hypothetical protein